MKRTHIKDKLSQLEIDLKSITLGDFDQIGEFTAKKLRSQNDPLYKSVGAFYRPNYERGILISSLIKKFKIKSMLEIGMGRGYATVCAAKAMHDMGFDDGIIYTVDVTLNDDHLKMMAQVFPREWISKINIIKGNIDTALPLMKDSVELVYIDGDHRYEAVKHDWDCVKDRFTKYALFDDYAEKEVNAIEVKKFVDELDVQKELIVCDRRIFVDDRGIPDAEIDYGQVLIKHPKFDETQFLSEW